VAAVLKKLYKDEFNKSNYRDISSFGWARQGMANGEVRIFIARWREASISTDSELKDFITSQSGIDSSKATQIKVLDKFSYMNLPEKEATLIMQYFKKENGARPVVVKAKENRNSGWGYRGGWRSGWGYRGWNSGGGWYRGGNRWGNRSGWGYRGGNSRGWYRGNSSRSSSSGGGYKGNR